MFLNLYFIVVPKNKNLTSEVFRKKKNKIWSQVFHTYLDSEDIDLEDIFFRNIIIQNSQLFPWTLS